MQRLLFLSVFIIACNSEKEFVDKKVGLNKIEVAQYNFQQADQTLVLPSVLNEISGISAKSDNVILAVNDELGKYFEFDLNTGRILNETKFHKAGDYEGITSTPEATYIIKSNGDLYKNTGPKNTKSFNTKLNHLNDIEGLCFDPAENCLLIACKGNPFIDGAKTYVHKRAIYKFSLETNTILVNDLKLISNDSLLSWYTSKGNYKALDNMAKMKIQSRVQSFSPSGIDIHPFTKEIYLLSARGKTIVVLSQDGTFNQVHLLDENQHTQPEGLCFSSNGDLYISNEGKYITPKLYKYNYRG